MGNKEHQRRWKEKNPDYNKNNLRELRELAREFGHCTNCFNEKDDPEHRTCIRCRAKMRQYDLNRRQKQKNAQR